MRRTLMLTLAAMFTFALAFTATGMVSPFPTAVEYAAPTPAATPIEYGLAPSATAIEYGLS